MDQLSAGLTDSTPPDQQGPGSSGEPTKISKKQKLVIIKEALERFKYVTDVDQENRRNAKDDTEFVWIKGKQWPDRIRLEREAENRPWLEINQLPQFIKQVVNDQRQTRPAIKIRPASGDASEKVSDTLEGLIRHVEYESSASAAYDSAFEHAVTSGRGYWRVCTDYESDKSFNQKLLIKRIPDPATVFMDPDYQEPDASDAEWCFVTETVKKEDFESRYPDAQPLDWDSAKAGDESKWFESGEKVLVADYFRKVYTPRGLVLLSDGTVAWKDELPKNLPEQITVVTEREGHDCTVEWHKVAGGQQIIESYEWAGKYLPVVMCVGDEIMVGGERIFSGLIRRARDVQTMYNFWQTQATELIALAPRVPWVAAEGQLEGYEDIWKSANIKNHAVLPYNPISVGGTVLGAPQRTQFAQVPTGIVEQANKCQQDLRATIGIYDPSLGQRSNEVSGRAIMARERQGDTATFHFVDNLSRAIQLTGRILIDLIPHIYDTQRILRIVAEDDSQEVKQVNVQQPMPFNPAQTITDPDTDLTTGEYAVTVDTGPSYQTRRTESAESMMEFVKAFPQVAPIIGDLIAKNMDWPGSEKIADRLKTMLPPGIQEMEKDGNEQIPPEAMRQMQQMHMQMQQMQHGMQEMAQKLQQAEAGTQGEVAKAQIAAKSHLQETTMQVQSDLDKECLQIAGDMVAARMKAEAQAGQSVTSFSAQELLAIAATLRQIPQPAPQREDNGVQQALAVIAGKVDKLGASRPPMKVINDPTTGRVSHLMPADGSGPPLQVVRHPVTGRVSHLAPVPNAG